MKRRDFLKNTIVVIAGASVPLSALEFIDPKEVLAANPQLHWAFLINTYTSISYLNIYFIGLRHMKS